MMVEFIGSTGAGKTTLIRDVQRRLAEKTEVGISFDLIAGGIGLRGLKSRTTKNIVAELVGFPFFLRALPRHKEFLAFTLRRLVRPLDISLFTVNNLRSIERKIGVYEFLRQCCPAHITLVDEGTVLSAHNLFVFGDVEVAQEEVLRFASLVPLPDLIVYVRAPVDVLVQRSLERSDAPREMKSKKTTQIENYLVRAVELFDQLVAVENILCRLLVVNSLNFEEQAYQGSVDRIANWILEKRVSN